VRTQIQNSKTSLMLSLGVMQMWAVTIWCCPPQN
jgi:hypothetical protein